MPTHNPPLLLFAFANERQNDAQYLRALSDERRAIEAALLPAERAGLCEVKTLPNATLADIFAAFQDDRYRDRIALFHYGGHANGAELLLERNDRENEPAHREGLVPLLRNQKSLQLVFLNGCSTEKWALALNEAGIPLVAGTFEAVKDEVALELAAQFYAGVGQGLPLRRAWDEAISKVKASGDGTMRGFGRGSIVLDRFPWELFQRRGAETAPAWNLPDANQNPLALIPLPEKYQHMPLPNEPFRFLDRYKKEDAAIFFGRGHAIRDLYDRLTNSTGSPLVLLSGQSGVGKSSLLDAGLLPRLEAKNNVTYVRRDPELGLVGTLFQALQCPADGDPTAAWQRIEQNEGKPLILILDQAEEAFTRDHGGRLQEVENLAKCIKQILGNTAQKPTGKLLVGFRKEYEGEIENAVKAEDIDYKYVFLKKLDRQDIVEVVTGLTSNPRLAQKYGLRVEEGLPETIAADLLTDSDTAVAPVLQIILTKLWQNAGNQRHFTQEAYLKLKEDGIFIGHFFQQQMEKLRLWEQKTGTDVERSGLALDVLNSHVTDLGFANSRSLDELKEAYQHRSDVLEALLKQFKELYLLTDAGANRNALAHDTLAPVVQQEVKNSDRPGQKASRILAGKLANYRRNANATYIPEDDLALVEQGRTGMRIWMDEEPELIQKSKDRRTAQRRQRGIALAALLLLAMLVAGFGWQYYQKIIIENWVSQARLEAATDPTIALHTLQKASQKAPDNPAVLAAFNDIWSENEFYEQVYNHPEPVKGVIWAKDSSKTLYSWTENALYRWSDNGARKDSFTLKNIIAAALSPDGRFLVLSTQEGVLAKIETNTLQQEEKTQPFGVFYATQLTFSLDGATLFAATQDSTVHNFSTSDLRNSRSGFSTPDEITALGIHPHHSSLLIGYYRGGVEERNQAGQVSYQSHPHKDRVFSISISPADSNLTSAGRDATIYFHGHKQGNALTLKGHDRRINAIRWSPDGSRLFSAGNDYMIKTWSPEGDPIATYRGHTGFVMGLSLSKDGQYFASAGEDKTVRIWKVESKVKQRYGPHPNGVSSICFGNDGHWVLSAADNGERRLGEILNDPNTPEEMIFDLMLGTGSSPRSAYIWEAGSGKMVQSLDGHKGSVSSIAQAPDQRALLTTSDDASSIVWHNENGQYKPFKTLPHQDKVTQGVFSPDGLLILTGCFDSITSIWNAQDGSKKLPIKEPSPASTVAFCLDNRQFLTGGQDGAVRLYDEQGVLVHTYQKPNEKVVERICLSPDGRHFLAGYRSDTLRMWSLEGKNLLNIVLSKASENKSGAPAISALAFSPDGQYFALGAQGGIAQVFRFQKKQATLIRTLHHYPRYAVTGVAFSLDGTGLLTASADGWGRWWAILPKKR